jgi:hypothetical protein
MLLECFNSIVGMSEGVDIDQRIGVIGVYFVYYNK